VVLWPDQGNSTITKVDGEPGLIAVTKSAKALMNHKLLAWARLSAGMPVEVGATKIGVTPEQLRSWEEGASRPTVNQLWTISRVYRQSFAAFYLATPPEDFRPPIHDYRRLPGREPGQLLSELRFDIREALDRRAALLEIYADAGEQAPAFNEQTTLRRNPDHVGERIRELTGVKFALQSRWRDPRVGFNHWRSAVESIGILVFQSKTVEVAEMRGYSVAEFPLPIIVVNRKDSYAGRTFTLLHELVHLMLRGGGMCDLAYGRRLSVQDREVEVFCNAGAAAALLPRADFLTHAHVRAHSGPRWSDDELESIARDFASSREAVLRRLLTLGRTNRAFYEAQRSRFLREQESRKKPNGFVPLARDVVSIAGKPFVARVLAAYDDGRATSTEVFNLLGVKLDRLPEVSKELRSELSEA
jgi:Zn-dependent peptidase ImmA (M78 family)